MGSVRVDPDGSDLSGSDDDDPTAFEPGEERSEIKEWWKTSVHMKRTGKKRHGQRGKMGWKGDRGDQPQPEQAEAGRSAPRGEEITERGERRRGKTGKHKRYITADCEKHYESVWRQKNEGSIEGATTPSIGRATCESY